MKSLCHPGQPEGAMRSVCAKFQAVNSGNVYGPTYLVGAKKGKYPDPSNLRSRLVQHAANVARQGLQRERFLQNLGRLTRGLNLQSRLFGVTRHEKHFHGWPERCQALRKFAAPDIRHN